MAEVDADRSVTECNEENNRATLTVAGLAARHGALTLAVSQRAYAPGEVVPLTLEVRNDGSITADYRVTLWITDANGTEVTRFAPQTLTALAPGARSPLGETWDSAGVLAGLYPVRAELSNAAGEPLATAEGVIEIRHPDGVGAEADLRLSTDRPLYHVDDVVRIEALLRNLTAATLIEGTRLHLRALDPGGAQVFERWIESGQLVQGGTHPERTELPLAGALQGNYRLVATLTEAPGDRLLAVADQTFEVRLDPFAAVAGTLEVAANTLYAGQSQQCLGRLSNTSGQALGEGLYRIAVGRVDVLEEHLIEPFSRALDAHGEASHTLVFDTAGFTPGRYVCVLQAATTPVVGWRTLDAALFELDPPPIVIDASLEAAPRGRLLVLLDDPAGAAAPGGRDPHGSAEAADLPAQRAWLEAKLREAGWSYTIVTSNEAFVREQRSGGYGLYLLHAEQIHLDVDAQRVLREAVRAGDGLVVGGDHDQRNARLDEALGIAFRGTLAASGLQPAGGTAIPFTAPRPGARVELAGALPLAGFTPDGEPAVTHHPFGAGEAVHLGFDLLAEAAAGGAGGEALGALLLGALGEVDPQPATRAGGPLAVRLTLINQGIATPGAATVALPAGVTVLDAGGATVEEAALRWTFDLAEAQSATFDAWLRLPPAGGPLTLTAAIETGTEADLVPYDTVEWSLAVPSPATVEEAQGLLPTAGLPRNQQVRVERDLAAAAAAEAGGEREAALAALLQAADVLLAADPAADPLRLAIARAAASLWRTP